MKTLRIPILKIRESKDIVEKINMILNGGVEAAIDQVNWKDNFPKQLPVTVRAAHDGEYLFLYYSVVGESVRAVNVEDFGSVWEDSCIEFFMQREGETLYQNFECNPLGVLLSRRNERKGKGVLQSDLMPEIFRYGTIQHRYESDKQVSDWTMYLEIPKQALGFADDETLKAQKIRGNFYKCGDKTPEPHFLSWNPINLPQPNFHTPEFFGVIELE